MEPETVAALGIAAIAIAVAVSATVLALHARKTKNDKAAALLKEQEAHGHLKTAHIRLGSTYAETERDLAAERAEHTTTRAKLDALKAKASERTRRGNLTRYAKRRALVQSTTAALQACVEARA